MYKYQSASFDDTIQELTPKDAMKFLRNGRVFWNLTKNSITHQNNGLVKHLPASFIRNESQEPEKHYRPQKQNLLPYHVLPLEETLPRFLDTVKPLLTPEEFEQQKELTEEFESNEGAKLQELLNAVGCEEKNWLADRWLKTAYLQYRDPVTVYVSPGMTFPQQHFDNMDDYLNYTAKVIYGLGEFKNIVDAGKIPILKMGKNELDNGQFARVFGTCRIPVRITDQLVYNPKSQYVVVIYKNHFYKLNLYNKCGELLTAAALAKELNNIVNAESEFGPPIGLLTTDTRDNWAEAYEHLMKLEGNCEALQVIQNSLFTVSLDECIPIETTPEANQLILGLIHGGGSKVNSANRWMDKTIQLVVNPNGHVGFTYEHSPAEGQPIAMMMDFVVKKMAEDKNFGECGASDDFEPAKKIKFCPVNPCIEQWLIIAERNIDKLVRNLQMQVLKFERYGKGFIKTQRLGPDSYVQMALQLAFFDMHKEPAAQYESAHLRVFENGRTETIRSCSVDSVEFCKAMLNAKCSDNVRADLLRKAVNSHQAYTKLALQGRGVDRHLLGLKLMAVENGKPVPKFFSSPGIVKSSNFRVSTSQVATTYDAFMGYGPSTPDGYGCCYNPRESDIICAISAFTSNRETNPVVFAKTLEKAFLSMQKTLINAAPAETKQPKAKL